MASEITAITIHFPKKKSGPIKAFASVEFNTDLVVHGFRVIDGKKGLFLSMPARETERDGERVFLNVVHPKRTDEDDDDSPGKKLGKKLEEKVIAKYRSEAKKAGSNEDEDL